MATNAANARVYGHDSDAIFLAPIGTTLPTDLTTALDAAFEDTGWLHADGITETPTGSRTEIRGHQGNGVVRTRMETPGTTVQFVALESKAQTTELRYDVKTSTTALGVRSQTRGPGQTVKARAAVIDLFDADDVTVRLRYVIPRLEVAVDGDRVYVNSDIAGFPFVGQIIGEYTSLETATDEPEVP